MCTCCAATAQLPPILAQSLADGPASLFLSVCWAGLSAPRPLLLPAVLAARVCLDGGRPEQRAVPAQRAPAAAGSDSGRGAGAEAAPCPGTLPCHQLVSGCPLALRERHLACSCVVRSAAAEGSSVRRQNGAHGRVFSRPLLESCARGWGASVGGLGTESSGISCAVLGQRGRRWGGAGRLSSSNTSNTLLSAWHRAGRRLSTVRRLSWPRSPCCASKLRCGCSTGRALPMHAPR